MINTKKLLSRIEKNIPIPKIRSITALMRIMEIGDSATINRFDKKKAYVIAKRIGIKIKIKIDRMWRVH